MDPIVVAALAASAMSLAAYFAYQLSVGRELSLSRKETSRFPLFAARDALVALVGDQIMAEDDLAWRNMYGGINHMLNMERDLSALDCIFRYASAMVAIKSNPAKKQRLDAAKKIEQEAARRVPEFAAVRASIDRAFIHLVRRRTTARHTAALFALRIAFLVMFGNSDTASEARRTVRHPSGRTYRGWVATGSDAIAA